MSAAEEQSIAAPVLVLLMLGASTLFGLGYLWAVMQRAKSDYEKTKAGLPGMRKGFWLALWAVIKIGFWVMIGGALLIAWAVNDIRDHDQTPKPVTSARVGK